MIRLRILWALLLISTSAFAGGGLSLEEARDNLSNGYQRYFEAIYSGKARSPEEISALKKQIIEPASSELGNYIWDRNTSAVKKHFNLIDKPPEKSNRREIELTEEQQRNVDGLLEQARGKKTLTAEKTAPKKSQTTALPERPETVLDGSGVPREVEFHKKGGAAITSPAIRQDGPGLKPSNAGDGVDEVQFR